MINPVKFFTKTEYTIAYRFSDKDIFEDTKTPFTVFTPKEEYWIADPFVFFYKNEPFIFVEVFDKKKNYAGIGCSQIINGKMTDPKIVIDDGTHMSYPQVFELNGKIFMVPENCANSKVRMFVCDRFPDKWTEATTIIEEPFYDTTIWKNDRDELLAFASLESGELYGSNLYLLKLTFSGDGLLATEKKLITTDNSISRQGGQVFVKDGELYRVSQDCSGMEYGKALNILKIEDDSYDNYKEKSTMRFSVNSFNYDKKIAFKQGVHTYNRAENFDIIDLKVGVFSVKCFGDKVRFAVDFLKKRL